MENLPMVLLANFLVLWYAIFMAKSLRYGNDSIDIAIHDIVFGILGISLQRKQITAALASLFAIYRHLHCIMLLYQSMARLDTVFISNSSVWSCMCPIDKNLWKLFSQNPQEIQIRPGYPIYCTCNIPFDGKINRYLMGMLKARFI